MEIMKLTKVGVLLLVLIVRMCITEIVVQLTEPPGTEVLVDAAAKILASCYDSQYGPIGIIGHLPKNLISTLWSYRAVPVITINRHMRFVPREYKTHLPDEKTRLRVFVIVAANDQEVTECVRQLRFSQWFDITSSFLLIDWSPSEYSRCSIATLDKVILYASNGAYNANAMCLDENSRQVIITSASPQNDVIPEPWSPIMVVETRNGKFVVLERTLRDGKEMCKNLDFDKTRNLGGNAIDFTGTRFTYTRLANTDDEPLRTRDIRLLMVRIQNLVETVLQRTNGRMRYNVWDGEDFNLVRGISLRAAYYNDNSRVSITYPLGKLNDVIMVKHKGLKTQLAKVFGVIDIFSRIGSVIVLLITVVFLKCVARQDLIPALINVVRIACGIGFENLPTNNSTRIFIGCVLFFIVTIHGILTGNLSSLLTTDVPVRHPKTVQDLVESNYKIYGEQTIQAYLTDFIIKERYVLMEDYRDCVAMVLSDPSTACLGLDIVFDHYAEGTDLYMSTEPVFERDYGLNTQFNWPLIDRVNRILSAMHEADIRDPLYFRVQVTRMNERKLEEMTYDEPKVMTLENLRFAFVILAVGWTLATITFIVELAIGRKRSNTRGQESDAIGEIRLTECPETQQARSRCEADSIRLEEYDAPSTSYEEPSCSYSTARVGAEMTSPRLDAYWPRIWSIRENQSASSSSSWTSFEAAWSRRDRVPRNCYDDDTSSDSEIDADQKIGSCRFSVEDEVHKRTTCAVQLHSTFEKQLDSSVPPGNRPRAESNRKDLVQHPPSNVIESLESEICLD